MATARGQQADATTGLANVARLEQSNALQSAQRKQTIRDANMKAGLQMGGTMLAQGLQNVGNNKDFFSFETEGAGKRLGEGLGLYVG